MITPTKLFGISSIFLATGLLAFSLFELRVNTTPSIPIGFYIMTDEPVSPEKYVIFCPPQMHVVAVARAGRYVSAGLCPGEYGYLMKKILAAKNDVITTSPAGIRINGRLIPRSQPLTHDYRGIELHAFSADRYVLGDDEYFLLSHHESGFDSRYFGPVNRSLIRGVVRPLWTW